MQVKLNLIVGTLALALGGTVSAQDLVVKIGHVAPTSGAIRARSSSVRVRSSASRTPARAAKSAACSGATRASASAIVRPTVIPLSGSRR